MSETYDKASNLFNCIGGLQADMAVFRDLLSARLPKLAKHLQKLQGPMGEGEFLIEIVKF